MGTRTVYYFCTRHFRGTGTYYYNQLVCQRIVAPDPRIAALEKEYYKTGAIYKIKYPSALSPVNFTWESEQILKANPWDFNNRIDVMTVENQKKMD